MLKVHVSNIITIKMPQALNHEDTDKCTLTITSPYIASLLKDKYYFIQTRKITQFQ